MEKDEDKGKYGKDYKYNYRSKVYCMLMLNIITLIENKYDNKLNLIAIGFSDNKIRVINLSTMKMHQIIRTLDTVYSLCQLNNNPKYLFSSLSNGYIMIYLLNQDRFEEIQKLEKPKKSNYGEINKIISLSNGDLASAERKAISIWKKK